MNKRLEQIGRHRTMKSLLQYVGDGLSWLTTKCHELMLYRVVGLLIIAVLIIGGHSKIQKLMAEIHRLQNEPQIEYVEKVVEKIVYKEPPEEELTADDVQSDIEITSNSVLPAVNLLLNSVNNMAGQLVRVIDGDTLVVHTSRGDEKIRLAGIDAPEITQSYGESSKVILEHLVKDKTLIIQGVGTDRYGRIVGVVKVDDLNVNKYMVEKGHAWSYPTEDKEINYLPQQQEAQKAKLGLWALKDAALPPWLFRSLAKTGAYCRTNATKGLYLDGKGLLHNTKCNTVTQARQYGTKLKRWDGCTEYKNCPSCGGCYIDK